MGSGQVRCLVGEVGGRPIATPNWSWVRPRSELRCSVIEYGTDWAPGFLRQMNMGARSFGRVEPYLQALSGQARGDHSPACEASRARTPATRTKDSGELFYSENFEQMVSDRVLTLA
jgi:hypothetical protein